MAVRAVVMVVLLAARLGAADGQAADLDAICAALQKRYASASLQLHGTVVLEKDGVLTPLADFTTTTTALEFRHRWTVMGLTTPVWEVVGDDDHARLTQSDGTVEDYDSCRAAVTDLAGPSMGSAHDMYCLWSGEPRRLLAAAPDVTVTEEDGASLVRGALGGTPYEARIEEGRVVRLTVAFPGGGGGRHITTIADGDGGAVSAVASFGPDGAEASLRAWGEAIQSELERGDTTTFRAAFSLERIVDAALAGTAVSDEMALGLREQLALQRPIASQLPSQMAREVAQGGSYVFRRVIADGDRWRVLFRLVTARGQLNYHDMMVRAADGVLIEDCHTVAAGELISQTVRRAMIQLIAVSPGIERGEIDDAVEGVMRIHDDYKNGRYAEVVAAIDTLPEDTRAQQYLQLLRLNAAGNLGHAETMAGLAIYLAAFPDDPFALLVRLHHHIARGEGAAALESLDALSAIVGPDAVLDALRAEAWLLEGDLEAARRYAAASVQAEPRLEYAWLNALDIARRSGDHVGAADALTALDARFGMVLDGILEQEKWQDFVGSPEGRAWRRGRDEK